MNELLNNWLKKTGNGRHILSLKDLNPTKDTWFISDPHFFHKNVIEFCNRPWANVEEMNEGLIESWNKHIAPNDLVFLLGDLSWKGKKLTLEVVKRLNGRIIFIVGNHDCPKVKLERWRKPDFGFEMVVMDMTIDLGEVIVNLSHFPYYPKWWQKVQAWFGRYDIRYLHRRLYDDGRWLIHGHVHEHWVTNGRMINAGVDSWGWRPMHLDEALGIIKNGSRFRRTKKTYKEVGNYWNDLLSNTSRNAGL